MDVAVTDDGRRHRRPPVVEPGHHDFESRRILRLPLSRISAEPRFDAERRVVDARSTRVAPTIGWDRDACSRIAAHD